MSTEEDRIQKLVDYLSLLMQATRGVRVGETFTSDSKKAFHIVALRVGERGAQLLQEATKTLLGGAGIAVEGFLGEVLRNFGGSKARR